MQLFNEAQLASIQRSINDDYSFHGELNPEERLWRSWYTQALEIDTYRSKKNSTFWDLRCHDFGTEFKKHKCNFKRPEDLLGKRIQHVGSRVMNLDGQPDRDPVVCARWVANGYNELVRQFYADCGNDARYGIVIHNSDSLVYYEEPVKMIDPLSLRAEWTLVGEKTNLWVYNEEGQKVFSFLPNGNKLSPYLPVPDKLSEVHYLKAEQDVIFERIEVDFYANFMAAHPGMAFQEAMATHSA